MGALPGAILTASTAGVFLYGGRQIIDGRLTLGTLAAFMAYHLRLLAPVQNMMGLSANVATAHVVARPDFRIVGHASRSDQNGRMLCRSPPCAKRSHSDVCAARHGRGKRC